MKPAVIALLLFAMSLSAAGASDANISFDDVIEAFRAAGYTVIGPMTLTTPSGQVSVISAGWSGAEDIEEFVLQLFDSDAAAIEGWAAAGNLIEIRRATSEALAYSFEALAYSFADIGLAFPFFLQAKTRGRAGRFVWHGTPGAMALFDEARN